MKTFFNEVLYFIHALFLVIFLLSGYEMIFHLGSPIDIMFGIIIGGYPIFVIAKDIKLLVDSKIDYIYYSYNQVLKNHKNEIEKRNKSNP